MLGSVLSLERTHFCGGFRHSVCICLYVVVNFLSQVIFIFPLFLGMVIYANEFETKEKKLPATCICIILYVYIHTYICITVCVGSHVHTPAPSCLKDD